MVVDCGGVGYRLAVSAETLRHVPPSGNEVTLHTHLVVRDDALALYGFASEEERDLFLMLLGVQSVGPKVALAVLSGGPPRELLAAVAAGDAARFQAVPGDRQAHRRADHRRAAREGRRGRCPTTRSRSRRGDDPRSLAREGLLGLGYAPARSRRCWTTPRATEPEELIAARAAERPADERRGAQA